MRFQTLDAFRGLACLGVLAFHATFYAVGLPAGPLLQAARLGWLGVPLFFVISGYCIAASGSRPGAVQEFIRRRFRRIYPVYWIALAGVSLGLLLLSALGLQWLYADNIHPLAPPQALHPLQWAGNLGLWEAWRPHLLGPERRYLLGTAWSLCYEEQFYALTAAGLLIYRRRLFPAFGAITLGVLALQVAAWKLGKVTTGFFFDGYWLAFYCGVLVYQWHVQPSPIKKRWLAGALTGFAALPILLPFLFQQQEQLATGLPVAAGFSLLLLFLSRWDEECAGSSIGRALAWLGVRCYSFYLLHWPVTKIISHLAWEMGLHSEGYTLAFTVPLCLGVSLTLTYWFHQWVERRFIATPSGTTEQRSHPR